MKQRIGAVLAILLGTALIVTGTTSGGASVGVSLAFCGTVPVGATAPGCPTGFIVITKDVHGSGTAPAGGWHFTITSSNCDFFPGSTGDVTIPAVGGTQQSDRLFATQSSNPSTGAGPACDYTVTETAVAGWTTTYSPTGVINLGQSLVDNNDRALTVTNTAIVQTSPPPTTTPVTTPVTTSVAPTPTASVSPTDILANTGSKSVKPATIAGIALVLVGVVLLFAGRGRRRAEH